MFGWTVSINTRNTRNIFFFFTRSSQSISSSTTCIFVKIISPLFHERNCLFHHHKTACSNKKKQVKKFIPSQVLLDDGRRANGHVCALKNLLFCFTTFLFCQGSGLNWKVEGEKKLSGMGDKRNKYEHKMRTNWGANWLQINGLFEWRRLSSKPICRFVLYLVMDIKLKR